MGGKFPSMGDKLGPKNSNLEGWEALFHWVPSELFKVMPDWLHVSNQPPPQGPLDFFENEGQLFW